MISIISPAKSLNFKDEPPIKDYSDLIFYDKSQLLVNKLKDMSANDLSKLMNISSDLSSLNKERYDSWGNPKNRKDSKSAIFSFNGGVYKGLDSYGLSNDEILLAQKKIRIISGLHGILRPLDRILPYRLEMGTKISVDGHENLYQYWSDIVTSQLSLDLNSHDEKVLVNLASNEYFKVVNKKTFPFKIITPTFKDMKNGNYRVISFFAKKARGMMINYIIKNNISNVNDLKGFDYENYIYNDDLSTGLELVFTRG